MGQQPPSKASITQGCQTDPPYPEILSLRKQIPRREFYFLGELENLFVKILLLHAMKDVSIYAKTIKEFFSKKPQRK